MTIAVAAVEFVDDVSSAMLKAANRLGDAVPQVVGSAARTMVRTDDVDHAR
ncbi:hypothetical protein OG894_41570 [Streptomyces sp. NBC_01724]|uniref:hypothetical protein n=1 Tax=unclassified Streptomyces TaxID=2593676 RepID=UPI002E305FEF|nr:hypothetical protein [Streptomyces sp. NBC_01724]WTE49277.1 hypothetical protein OG987_00220 [Streptomyces sp. NBC_01620]